jgi:hypothetical protein
MVVVCVWVCCASFDDVDVWNADCVRVVLVSEFGVVVCASECVNVPDKEGESDST